MSNKAFILVHVAMTAVIAVFMWAAMTGVIKPL